MSRPTSDPEALIAALGEDARRRADPGSEPEPEELLDYLAGNLSREAQERLERRLVASPEAARRLLELSELAEAQPAPEGTPVDLAVRAGWRDFQTRIAEPGQRTRRLPPWLLGLAASLFLLTVGLGLWVWKLQVQQRRPVANLASLELKAAARGGEEPAVELVPGAPLRLVLEPERCPNYDAELAGPGPKDRLTIAGLERNERGQLTPLLQLEPGEYELRLFGCEPNRQLESYRFRITRGGND